MFQEYRGCGNTFSLYLALRLQNIPSDNDYKFQFVTHPLKKEPKVCERGAKEEGSGSKRVQFFSLELQSPKKAMKQRELIKFVYRGASCQRATGKTK